MTPPATLPMTAEAVRTRAALTREFLDRNMAPADIESLRMELNKYVSEKDTGLKARQMVEELFKILPDAFPPAVLDGGLDDVIYSRTMVLLHHAIEKKNQFDWDWGTLYNGEFFWHEWVREVKNYLDVEQRTAQRSAAAQSPGAGGGQGPGSGMAPGAGTGGARGAPTSGGGQAAPGTPPGRQGGTMPTGASPSSPAAVCTRAVCSASGSAGRLGMVKVSGASVGAAASAPCAAGAWAWSPGPGDHRKYLPLPTVACTLDGYMRSATTADPACNDAEDPATLGLTT